MAETKVKVHLSSTGGRFITVDALFSDATWKEQIDDLVDADLTGWHAERTGKVSDAARHRTAAA